MCLRFRRVPWSRYDEDVMYSNLWRNNKKRINLSETEVVYPVWFQVPAECRQQYEAGFIIFLVNITVDRVVFSHVKTSDI
jgi:hypothetical protein